jgi:hypothetical protein
MFAECLRRQEKAIVLEEKGGAYWGDGFLSRSDQVIDRFSPMSRASNPTDSAIKANYELKPQLT